MRTYRPPTGGAVVFCCSLQHEATPVTRGRRYAFLPFLYGEGRGNPPSQRASDRRAGPAGAGSRRARTPRRTASACSGPDVFGERCRGDALLRGVGPGAGDIGAAGAFQPGAALRCRLASAVVVHERGEALLELQAREGGDDLGHLLLLILGVERRAVDVGARPDRHQHRLRPRPPGEPPVVERDPAPDHVRRRGAQPVLHRERLRQIGAVDLEGLGFRREGRHQPHVVQGRGHEGLVGVIGQLLPL